MYDAYGEGLGYVSGKKCMVKSWGMPQVRSVW